MTLNPYSSKRDTLGITIMKTLAAAILLFALSAPVFACSPVPPPPGVQRRWASVDEAKSLVPFIAVGSVSIELDETSKLPRFRLTVEQWLKGDGPDVVYVHGSFHSRHVQMPTHSCMIELPVNLRIVILLKSVDANGRADGIHEFEYLKNSNLFVRPVWRPAEFGLKGQGS